MSLKSYRHQFTTTLKKTYYGLHTGHVYSIKKDEMFLFLCITSSKANQQNTGMLFNSSICITILYLVNTTYTQHEWKYFFKFKFYFIKTCQSSFFLYSILFSSIYSPIYIHTQCICNINIGCLCYKMLHLLHKVCVYTDIWTW